MTAAPRHARIAVLEPGLFTALLVLMAAMIATVGPLLTSDGPAHVSIAHFLRHAGDPAWPQLNRLYEINPALTPNALGHWLLAGLMFVFPPLGAEMALQAICLLGLPLAARLVLRRISPGGAWLALFFIPVALQRLMLLGLYNYCLSVIGFLLCLWAWLGMRERPTRASLAVLAALLLLTLACQASGWIEALVAIVAMLTVDALLARDRKAVLRRTVATVAATVPSAALFLVFAAQATGGAEVVYGASPLVRIVEVLRGVPFATIGRMTAAASLAMTLALLAVLAIGAVCARRIRLDGAVQPAMMVAAVPLALVAFMLVVPERAGGGWSHIWRAQAFVLPGLALAAAALPQPAWMRLAAIAVGAGGSLVMIGATAWLQATQVPPVVARFAELEAIVAPHCTVAPILGHYKLDRDNTAQLIHHPTFHLAHRIQWSGDRPVLFSYNARLSVYPARFRAGADPQRLLYGWEPMQGDTLVRQMDIPRWETATGIPVDFVLLWDVLPDGEAGPHHGLRGSALHDYTVVHRSADGRMELYRRGGSARCGPSP